MTTKYTSIWDGWEHQCFGRSDDKEHGVVFNCAGAFPFRNNMWGYWEVEHNTPQAQEIGRVARYIRRMIVSPLFNLADPDNIRDYNLYLFDMMTIQYCNDVLQWTPAQFREIDIASQIEDEFKEQLIFAGIDPEKYEVHADMAAEGADHTVEIEVLV